MFFARRDMSFYFFQISEVPPKPNKGRQIRAKFRVNRSSDCFNWQEKKSEASEKYILPLIFFLKVDQTDICISRVILRE